MFYTISKGLLWYGLALLLGFVVGYLLRSIAAKRQVSRARATATRPDNSEVVRLRSRIANLEPVVAERDRLRAELARARGVDESEIAAGAISGDAAVAPAVSRPAGDQKLEGATLTPAATDDDTTDAAAGDVADETATEASVTAGVADEVEPAGDMPSGDEAIAGDAPPIGDAEGSVDDADEQLPSTVDEAAAEPVRDDAASVADAGTEPASGVSAAVLPDDPTPPPPPDVADARAVLGKSLKLDDLTAIEGIGPKIAELCEGIGIQSWFELATTEVSLLQTMLNDAGARYQVHDPTTWPRQAGYLAAGEWQAFKDFTDQLDHGR